MVLKNPNSEQNKKTNRRTNTAIFLKIHRRRQTTHARHFHHNIRQRLSRHKFSLKKNIHENSGSI